MPDDDFIPLEEYEAEVQQEQRREEHFDFFPAHTLPERAPPRQWTIDEYIPSRVVTLFSGHGGMGKSTMITDMLVAKATGRAWLGIQTEEAPCIAVFAEEEKDEIHRRLVTTCHARWIGLGALDNLILSGISGHHDALAVPDARGRGIVPTDAYWLLREQARDIGAKLVTLDPVADLFEGDEIDRVQVRQFVGLLSSLAREINGAVVLAAHPSQQGIRAATGYSGSTAWHNSVRSLVYLSAPEKEDGDTDAESKRTLHHLKCNLGPRQPDVKLQWNEGVFDRLDPATGQLAAIDATRIETAFLQTLDMLERNGEYVSDNARGGRFAPRVMAGRGDCRGIGRKELQKAMYEMLDLGRLRVIQHGAKSKGLTKLVRNDAPQGNLL